MPLRSVPPVTRGPEAIAEAAVAEGLTPRDGQRLIASLPSKVRRGMAVYAGEREASEADWRQAWASELAGLSEEEVRLVLRVMAAEAGAGVEVYDDPAPEPEPVPGPPPGPTPKPEPPIEGVP